ncbi:hypothetical protein BH11PSE3_BH11PSE3_30330 [soil metagenome]
MTDRLPYEEAVRRAAVLERLRAFDPRLVGTLPLGIAVATSDVDIVCHVPDAGQFAEALWTHFRKRRKFALHQWSSAERPVVARFDVHGWPFEIFGSPTPVQAQAGWRHFHVERRLLVLGGAGLRSAVMSVRFSGSKTEPAFAAALQLAGDPYAALLALYHRSDATLTALLANAGFRAA